MRGPGDVEGRAERRRHRLVGGGIVEPAQHQRPLGLRLRHHLERHLGHDRQRAPGSGQQLAEIIAGDVLHHLAAGLEAVAEAGDRVRPEQMVARPARLDPARTGRPAAIMPPMVPDPGAPSSGAVFIGSNANCWFLAIDQRQHVVQRRAGLHA